MISSHPHSVVAKVRYYHNTSVKPTRGPLTNASDTGSSMFRLFAFVVPRINTSAKPSIKRAVEPINTLGIKSFM